MGKNIYLNTDNVEEVLEEVINEFKNKIAHHSRAQAFEDCTKYWAEKIEEIIKDDCPNGAKISRICSLFGIESISE